MSTDKMAELCDRKGWYTTRISGRNSGRWTLVARHGTFEAALEYARQSARRSPEIKYGVFGGRKKLAFVDRVLSWESIKDGGVPL